MRQRAQIHWISSFHWPKPSAESSLSAIIDSYLKAHIPSLSGEPQISQFPGGASNLTYLLEYPQQEFVLRRPPFGHKAKSAHDMGREFRIISQLGSSFPYCPKAYVHCTDEAVIGYDTNTKMNPPLRSRADRDALLAGITDGTIEVIATDHAPHTAAEKSRGLAASAMGVVGLECAFPLLYKYMVLPGIITLEKLIALMAVNPRRIFGLGGGLHVGDQADFTVLDLDARYRVDPATFLSMGRATPFAGWEVQGRAAMTVVGGREVFRDETMKTNR